MSLGIFICMFGVCLHPAIAPPSFASSPDMQSMSGIVSLKSPVGDFKGQSEASGCDRVVQQPMDEQDVAP